MSKPRGILRRLLPYTTAILVASAIYAGWVIYSRHAESKRSDEEIKSRQAQKEVAADRSAVAAYGGDELKILSFSASPRAVHPGDRVRLCYGVANAVKVKIEPGVEPLKPALTHCTEAVPKKTTTFTLTAEDQAGHTVQGAITVQVN